MKTPKRYEEIIARLKGKGIDEYRIVRENRQKEFDALPIFAAFNAVQFKEELEKRQITSADIYSLGYGTYIKKSDYPLLKEWSKSNPIEKLMDDYDFAITAFVYEMENHEYAINYYQRNWDVLNCFSKKELTYDDNDSWQDYLNEMGKAKWAEA